jgi:ABC-type nitrate/sulfonate/bicarbonate transport system permease component
LSFWPNHTAGVSILWKCAPPAPSANIRRFSALGSDAFDAAFRSSRGHVTRAGGADCGHDGTALGAIVGFVSGYFGGLVDAVLRILIDVFLAVPSLLFLILIASLFKGVGVQAMAIIIGLFAWSWPARQVRAQVLSLKERSFVEVARLSGMSGLEIIFRELMPHMIPWLGANFVNAFIAAILAESGLSILGLGPQQQMTVGDEDTGVLSPTRPFSRTCAAVDDTGHHPHALLRFTVPDSYRAG